MGSVYAYETKAGKEALPDHLPEAG
jgi:hypothetical protein